MGHLQRRSQTHLAKPRTRQKAPRMPRIHNSSRTSSPTRTHPQRHLQSPHEPLPTQMALLPRPTQPAAL